jgi:hypothetical protein
VLEERPAIGFHIYVEAPFAVKDILPPGQTFGFGGVMTIVGGKFTVTVALAVPEQPPSVPVTK